MRGEDDAHQTPDAVEVGLEEVHLRGRQAAGRFIEEQHRLRHVPRASHEERLGDLEQLPFRERQLSGGGVHTQVGEPDLLQERTGHLIGVLARDEPVLAHAALVAEGEVLADREVLDDGELLEDADDPSVDRVSVGGRREGRARVRHRAAVRLHGAAQDV